MADWVNGKVKNRVLDRYAVQLYVHAPVHPFTAGQFTKLGLEIDGRARSARLFLR
jgi:ferredoxin--NADP+ reductase